MSKFLFSNKQLDAVVGKSGQNGFTVSGKAEVSGSSFVAFHKLNMENVNFIEVGDEGFISLVGTWVYNESIGEKALINIYNIFNGEEDIATIRDTILGNCAFIIRKNNKVYIFGDNYSLYSIYYYIKDGAFVISNNLMDIANIVDVEPEWNNLFEQLCFESIYCGGTFFKNVFRLTDDKYLVFDTNIGKWSIHYIKNTWAVQESDSLSYNEIVEKVAMTLSEDAAVFAKVFGTPGLSSTGGLDNRMNLAALLSVGIKPDLYYGVGNSSVTNTYNEDAEVNKLYAEKFGLKFQLNSWATPKPINRDWELLLGKYGFDYSLYSGSADIFGSYENIKNKSILFGYYGEIYRNLDFVNNLTKDEFTIDEYIDNYLYKLFDPKEIIIPDEEAFRNHVKQKLISICEKWGIDPSHISKEKEVYLSMERRAEGDTLLINWVNYHHYCCLFMAQKHSLKYVIRVSTKRKEHSSFMIDLLNKLYAPVLEVPVFTHQHYMVYDKGTNSLIEPKGKKSLYITIKEHLPSNSFVTMLKRSSLGAAIRNRLISEKKAEERKNDSNATVIIDEIMSQHNKRKGLDYGGHGFGGMIQKTIQYAMILLALDSAKVLK